MTALKAPLYALAMITSLACAVLLVRSWLATKTRLLAWSALCFVFLSLNNTLLFIDLVVLPQIDLRLYRHLASLAGMLCLLYGFIWEAEP